jgi:hypothetical protein
MINTFHLKTLVLFYNINPQDNKTSPKILLKVGISITKLYVLNEVKMSNVTLWNLKLCSILGGSSSTMKMEKIRSSRTLVSTYMTLEARKLQSKVSGFTTSSKSAQPRLC